MSLKGRLLRTKIVRFVIEDDPRINAWFHKWQAIFWIANLPIALLWLKSSIEYLVVISLVALIIGSIGAHQQAKGEIKMDKVIETAEKAE